MDRFCKPLQLAGHATRSDPDSFPLLIPQRWRINRQIKQRDVVRQCDVQDGRHDVGSQRGQVDHPANVAVVDSFPRGDLLTRTSPLLIPASPASDGPWPAPVGWRSVLRPTV